MTWNEFKAKAKEKWEWGKEWCSDHKEEIIIFGPPLIAGTVAVAKGISRNHQIKLENERRGKQVWDPQNGTYLNLRKPLTNSEKMELDARRRSGMSVTEALWAMGKID